jgi:hypothetical protein
VIVKRVVQLDAFEVIALTGAGWAMFEPEGNVAVGQAFADVITTAGIDLDPYTTFRVIAEIVEAQGHGEVTDTAVREVIIGRLKDVAGGAFPIKKLSPK